eukprot:NODE_314_length_9990_cov_0.963401.p5 type:complete len:222 gc:universal NODE_314_length_9990_cov_0.963401:7114-7779(+)
MIFAFPLKMILKRFLSKQRIWTLPNLLTMSRIAMTPALFITLTHNQPAASLILLSAAASTDLLDGYIARKFNQSSNFGSFLDPFADKFFMFTSSCALYTMNMMPQYVFFTFIGRDLLLLGTSLFWRHRTLPPPKSFARMMSLIQIPSPQILPTRLSKINTVLQLSYIGMQIVKLTLTFDISVIINVLEKIVVATSIWSTFQYMVYPTNYMKLLKSKNRESK